MVSKALPFALLALAACARSEEASLVPSDDNAARSVERVRTPERDDQELALGEWRDSLQEEEAALEFGPSGAAPLFSLRCDERRGVLLQRHGVSPAGDLPVMLITIGSETRRLAVTSAGGPIPMVRATLNASDQLLRTLSEVALPIAIRIGDSPPLILPPSPLIGAFVTQCASGEERRVRAADAAANASAETNRAEPAAE